MHFGQRDVLEYKMLQNQGIFAISKGFQQKRGELDNSLISRENVKLLDSVYLLFSIHIPEIKNFKFCFCEGNFALYL